MKSDTGRIFFRYLSKSWSLIRAYRRFDKKFRADFAFERTSAEASLVNPARTCMIFNKSLFFLISARFFSNIFRKHRAVLALICEERELVIHWKRTFMVFESFTDLHTVKSDFSASPEMKMLVSALFLSRQLRIISSSGSTSLLRYSQISPMTIRAFLLREDLRESAHLMICRMRLWKGAIRKTSLWNFISFLMPFSISNCIAQSFGLILK